MPSTTYFPLQPRSPSNRDDLELGGGSFDADETHRPRDATPPPRRSEVADTLQRATKGLRSVGTGAAAGFGFGTVGGLAASSAATVAWLGSAAFQDDEFVSAEATALWKALYRGGIVGHTVLGAAAGTVLTRVPQPQFFELVKAYACGQFAGGAAALGGTLFGSFLGNFGTFVCDQPADPVTGILRPSLGLAAYLAASLSVTYMAHQEFRTLPRPPAESMPSA